MISEIQKSWTHCWTDLQADGDGLDLMARLIDAYRQPQLHYHTLQHLEECLNLWSKHAGEAQQAAEVGMALWFHDAVYEVKAADNEERSAAWAMDELGAVGVAAAQVERIGCLILASAHRALPQGRDAQLLVDIDLAILGASRERFDEYEAQVRREYSWVPEDLFRTKRAEVLARFLQRKPLYHTPALRNLFEARAIDNLRDSLTLLGKPV